MKTTKTTAEGGEKDMTDTAKLKDAISTSGLKFDHIAQQMGISRASLYNYINNRTEFRASHIEKLSTILGLEPEQRMAIFFADGGVLKPPTDS